MKATLLALFTSKKFLAAVTALIVYVAGRFGFDLDTVALDHIFAALLVYVGAQGIADNGKSAAAIAAVAENPTHSVAAGDAMRRIAGSVSMVVLVMLAFGACGAADKPKAVAVDTERGIVKCIKADTGPLLALYPSGRGRIPDRARVGDPRRSDAPRT